MKYRTRRFFTEADKILMWDLSVFKQMEQTERFSKGELCSSITYYAACR